jgi:23S rRNA (cytidine1920-2'-O)/16S rRNA (cytidine1409-2'-O)-methyltransferase
MKKQRADLLLVAAGLAESRAKAQALIMAGLVYAGTARVQKSGDMLPEGVEMSVKGQDHPWVSRGGVKLAHGLAHFGLSPAQKICLDIGASTGGFTDVLLTRGAEKVFAVDAGHDQLAWKLRSDERVIVMEKTNARYLNADLIPEQVQVVVCDASFIGLQTVLPAGLALCAANAFAIALIKPQFEAGPAQLSKGGVVRDPAVHQEVCARITAWWQGLPGWTVLGITPSPITGPAGNVEFLIAAQKT